VRIRLLTIAVTALLTLEAQGQVEVYPVLDAEGRVHLYHNVQLQPGDSLSVFRLDPGSETELAGSPLGARSNEYFDRSVAPVLRELELEMGLDGAGPVRDFLRRGTVRSDIFASVYPEVARALSRVIVDASARPGQNRRYRVSLKRVVGPTQVGEAAVRTRSRVPDAPTGLRASNRQRLVTATWDYPLENEEVSRFVVFEARGDSLHRVHEPPVLRVQEADSFSVDFLIPELGDRRRFVVKAIDLLGQISVASDTLSFLALDTTPPEAVTGLAVAEDEVPIRITWNPAPETDIASYRIYRSTGGTEDDAQEIASVAASDLLFEDRSTIESRPYRYYVTAIDESGNESPRSDPIAALVRDRTPPAAPFGVGAEFQEGMGLTLTWDLGQQTDLQGVQVFRELASSDAPSAMLVADTLSSSFTDSGPVGVGLHQGAFYRYTLVARDSTLNASDTTRFEFQIPDVTPPGPPIEVIAEQDSFNRLVLSWTAPVERDVSLVRIYKNDSLVEERSTRRATATTIGDVEVAIPYVFHLVAVDSLGNESVPSERVEFAISDRDPPGRVIGLELSETHLSWVGALASDVLEYAVRCSESPTGPFDGPEIKVGSTQVETQGLSDPWCAVLAIDNSGNRGPWSNSVRIGGGR
jgi:fibronectin type 3 domain-containing protein